MIIKLLQTTRPIQWTKNLMVFLPALFSFNESWVLNEAETSIPILSRAFITLGCFVLASSAIYMFNDVIDADKDKLHPNKKYRPVASGRLGKKLALTVALILAAGAIFASSTISVAMVFVLLSYLLLMLVYAFFLREIILLDVFCISAGFIIRVVAGAIAIGVPMSPWLYVCMGFGSLYIALSKRMGELMSDNGNGHDGRKLLEFYTQELLSSMLTIVLSATLIAYCLYTFIADNLPSNNSMMLTIPFVVYGMLRYLYLVRIEGKGERPEIIIVKDIPILLCVGMWFFVSATVLYLYR